MAWTVDRTTLLPKSSIGIVAPWLVIAPPGNPVIRLDLRALDEVTCSADDEPDTSEDDPEEEVDVDHHLGCHLVLVCGELEVAIYVSDGSDAVGLLVREAAPLTREATGHDSVAALSELLIVGDDPVFQRGDLIVVGNVVSFRTSAVREYALAGANLPLPGGRLLQAAMALLVVAAAERDAAELVGL